MTNHKFIVPLLLLIQIIMKQLPLFLLIILLLSCNGNRQANEIIDRAESIVSANPDSALILLQSIHEPEALTDSVLARYWLVNGQAHYNCDRSTAEDSLLKNALDYYKEHSDIIRTTQAYKLFAQHLWWKGDRTGATNTLLEGIEVARAAQDTTCSVQLLNSIAIQSIGDENFADAVKYLKELLAMDGNSPDAITNYSMLGISYYYLQQKDSALFYSQKACREAEDARFNRNTWAFLAQNYANILSDFGEHHRAIDVQHEILRHYLTTKDPLVSLAYNSLGRYYLNLHQMDSVRHYTQLAKETYSPHIAGDFSLSNYYLVQSTLMQYISTNQFIIKDVALFSDRMFENYHNREKVIAEKNETKRVLEQRNLYLSSARQRDRMLLVIVLLAVALTAVLVIFYIQRRKKLLEEKEEELDTLKHLWADVEKANSENDQFFKKILLQQMGIIRMIATNPTPHNQEFLTQMTRIAQKDIPTDELLVWEDLYKVINSIYGNFYTHILTRFGNVLNERELQLCCLLKANFSTKEISVVTQQSVRTVYQRKTTIRQKLNMDEKEDIADFLSQ